MSHIRFHKESMSNILMITTISHCDQQNIDIEISPPPIAMVWCHTGTKHLLRWWHQLSFTNTNSNAIGHSSAELSQNFIFLFYSNNVINVNIWKYYSESFKM